MKRVLLYALCGLTLISLLPGCHEEEPPPPPHAIVGNWTLDAIILTNLPTNFKNWEGQTFTPSQWFGVDINGYRLDFNQDSTYLLTIDLLGPNETENGKWKEADNILVMSPDGQTFDYEYEIVGAIEPTEMTLSERISGATLLPDGVTDTLSDATWNNAVLMDTIWNQYGTPVDLDIWWIYNR